LDGKMFVVMILSRTARSAAAFGGAKGILDKIIATNKERPSDQGRDPLRR
jgi:hypothetical protein